jgi:alkylation response protein AidB-like acyl-CoA dehydrogenase
MNQGQYRTHRAVGSRSVLRMADAESRIFTIFEGTSEIQGMIVGRAVTVLVVR